MKNRGEQQRANVELSLTGQPGWGATDGHGQEAPGSLLAVRAQVTSEG